MLIGEILIIISGLFLGYIFPDLLDRYGAGTEFSYSYLSPVALAFISVIAYFTRPIWINANLKFAGLEGFTSSIFLWLAITLMIGGYVRIIQHCLLEK